MTDARCAIGPLLVQRPDSLSGGGWSASTLDDAGKTAAQH
jgi:hypothetical protein